MKYGLSESLLANLNSIFSRYPEIETVILYGSRAKGNFQTGSDINLTMLGKKLNQDIRSGVWLAIDDLNTPYGIDLSILKEIDSEGLRDHISRVGIPIYQNSTITQ